MTTPEHPRPLRLAPIAVGLLAIVAATLVSDGSLPRSRPRPAPVPVRAQLSVLVVAKTDGWPIGGASVRIEPESAAVTTGPDGVAELRSLRVDAVLNVLAPGFAMFRGTIPPLGPSQRLRVELEPGRRIDCRIVDADDHAIPGARISVRSDDEPDEPAIEGTIAGDGSGYVDHLRPGHWLITASAEGYEPISRLVVIGEAEPPTERFLLVRTGGLAVRVVDAQQRPVAGASVTLGGIGLPAPRTADTDAAGTVRFEGLSRGLYEARASLGNLASRRASAISIEPSRAASVTLTLEASSVVSGSVVDASGAPLPGVEIAISEDALDLVPRTARTDASGRFRFDAIPNRPHVLVARLEGYLPYGPAVLVPGETLPTFTLQRSATIRGRIVDADGEPVVGAVVMLVNERGEVAASAPAAAAPTLPLATGSAPSQPMLQAAGELGVTLGDIPPIPLGAITATPLALSGGSAAASTLGSVTDRNGIYVLVGVPPGVVQLAAHHPAHPSVTSEPRRIASGAVIDEWNLVFLPAGTVEALVVDSRNRPIAGVPVELRTDRDDVPRTGMTGYDGRITFEGVDGICVITAMPAGRPAGRARAEVSAGRRVEVVLALDDDLVSLAGKVVDERGAPIEGARVVLTSLRARTVFESFAMSEVDGTFRFDGIPQPPYRIVVDHPSYARKRLDEVRPERGSRLEIRLQEGGSIDGDLVDEDDGRPIERAIVSLYEGEDLIDEDATDGRGRFRFERVTPGRYRIKVRSREYLPYERNVTLAPARYEAPHLSLGRIELLGAFVIRGVVVDALGDPVERARVYLPFTLGSPSAFTDARGQFEIRGVAPGTHEIQAEHVRAGAARGRRPIRGVSREVVSDVEIRLPGRRAVDSLSNDPALVRGVAIVLDTAAADVVVAWVGPTSAADVGGIRVGDVLLSIDGEPCVELLRCRTLLRGPLEVPTDLVLRRGSSQRRLRVGRELYRPPPDELVLRR